MGWRRHRGKVIVASNRSEEIGHKCSGLIMADGSIFPPCDCADSMARVMTKWRPSSE